MTKAMLELTAMQHGPQQSNFILQGTRTRTSRQIRAEEKRKTHIIKQRTKTTNKPQTQRLCLSNLKTDKPQVDWLSKKGRKENQNVTMGWGDGSVDKVLPMQAGNQSSDPQKST